MKPDKFRDHLQNRTITPSSGSWDKLNEKLNAHENKKKSRNWMILKIASFILLLITVGIYYFQPQGGPLPSQEIAAPASRENPNGIPDNETVNEIKIAEKSISPETQIDEKSNVPEIAVIQEIPVNKRNQLTHKKGSEPNSEKISFSSEDSILITSSDQDMKASGNDVFSEEMSSAEKLSADEDLLDEEIEQLLHNSKLKLIVNGQISPKKYVNTDALLNSVEDDLDKDLREKLIEKIVNTLKKDKEVVTSEEK